MEMTFLGAKILLNKENNTIFQKFFTSLHEIKKTRLVNFKENLFVSLLRRDVEKYPGIMYLTNKYKIFRKTYFCFYRRNSRL